MANIDPYIKQIQDAVYGEEVRSSIINALQKVNDDNESYIELKKEVVSAKDAVVEQVNTFDGKVSDAKSTTDALESATQTANTAKTNLENATSTANTAKDNLTNATTAANTAKDNVVTATQNANTATTNANTAKTNLENTISTAGTSNTQLQTVIDSANTTKTALDGSKNTADTVLQSLTAENTSAKSNLSELRSENFNSQEILAGVADLRAYLGLSDDDILGLQVDYKNKTFKRIAGATNLTAGSDFDAFSMYGGRKRCNVADDGTINAWYGDSTYTEDGSNGQVMVYQPKFYYLVCPVVYDPITTSGIGYHLRKANYYVSAKPRPGFRLHPAFYDANGNEVDYVLIGAYEGSIYDASASAYLLLDEQVMSVGEDKFCSIAGVKPASGLSQDLTRPKIETMAQNRGACWHLENAKIASMEQLLCMIEMGTMNFQTAIGQGVVNISDNGSYNCASLTGSTANLGNGTGMASETINVKGSTRTTETANGKTSVSYRGVENDWGNIWKFIIDPNIYGNGAMDGGQPFYCDDFSYSENKNTSNYKGAGFTVTNANGYISAMGYSTACDWLFMASECKGDSNLPVGDYTYVTPNLNGYRIALLGGGWDGGTFAGPFYWYLRNGVGGRNRGFGGRLVYVPNA